MNVEIYNEAGAALLTVITKTDNEWDCCNEVWKLLDEGVIAGGVDFQIIRN